MSTFVLIHGGWAGGWVWEKAVPILESAGHRVLTPDLPGHSDDRTPVREITLERYAERVLAVLDAATEPVVLVGHSSGGVVITQAAERRPERIALLVYLCAYLPDDGQSLFELGRTDAAGMILPNLVVSEDGATATIRSEVVREALFADCAEEDYERFGARVVPEPLAAVATPVQVTPERFGRVPRAYIVCRCDRAISPELQQRMYTAVPCDTVVAMDTSHMPQYAAPETLAAHLSALAGAAPDRRAAVQAQDFR
jgi:pimeloyl-ACP methyl ester carboxylesterase